MRLFKCHDTPAKKIWECLFLIGIFQLSSNPPLPTLTLSSGTPAVGADVMMIGRGRVQNPESFWLRTEIPGPNNDTWELAGMMFAISTFENQPGGNNTAVFGNQTFSADLSAYSSQFLHLVPEPSLAMLAVAGLGLMFRRRRQGGLAIPSKWQN